MQSSISNNNFKKNPRPGVSRSNIEFHFRSDKRQKKKKSIGCIWNLRYKHSDTSRPSQSLIHLLYPASRAHMTATAASANKATRSWSDVAVWQVKVWKRCCSRVHNLFMHKRHLWGPILPWRPQYKFTTGRPRREQPVGFCQSAEWHCYGVFVPFWPKLPSIERQQLSSSVLTSVEAEKNIHTKLRLWRVEMEESEWLSSVKTD